MRISAGNLQGGLARVDLRRVPVFQIHRRRLDTRVELKALADRVAGHPGLTGRQHQVRLHCSAIGHPVAVDRLYGGADGAWLELFRELRGDVDWTGLEDEERRRWHEQPHLFRSPLYYIEYGIAQIGALQLWRNFRQNRKVAVRAFRSAMALGGARPLHELFAAAGATFEMGDAMLAGLVEEVAERLRSVE